MKKAICAALALTLALGTTAMAADQWVKEDHDTTVTYNAPEANFTITVPSDITLESTHTTSAPNSEAKLIAQVTNYKYEEEVKDLVVKLKYKGEMTHESAEGKKATYTLYTTFDSTCSGAIAKNSEAAQEALRLSAAKKDAVNTPKTVTLYAAVDSLADANIAGVYTETVTFEVAWEGPAA